MTRKAQTAAEKPEDDSKTAAGEDQAQGQASEQTQQPEGDTQAGQQDQAQAQADTQSQPEGEPEAQAQAETQAAETPAEPVVQPVLFRIEQARNLPELDKEVETRPADYSRSVIEAFKAADGRTMRVVELDGTLYAQEA